MKRNLLPLALVLMLALPVLGLAEATAAPSDAPAATVETPALPAEEAEYSAALPVEEAADTTAQTAPWTGRYGRRNQTPAAPGAAFTDEDGDGVCDLCSGTPGTREGAPGFTDEDGNGVCDHRGKGNRGHAGAGRGRMGSRGRQGANARGGTACPCCGQSAQGGMGRGMNREGRGMRPFGPGMRQAEPGNGPFGPGRR